MPTPAKNIDEYLKNVTPVQRVALQKLREQIRSIVPQAEECISYSMPAFRGHGHVFAGFLATKKGCSYFPFSGITLDGMAAELTGYSRTKSGLHFNPEEGLPVSLLRKLIKARQAEIAHGTTGENVPRKKTTAKKKTANAKKKTTNAKKKTTNAKKKTTRARTQA